MKLLKTRLTKGAVRVLLLPCASFKGFFHDLRFLPMIYPECLGFGSTLAA